MPISWMKMGMHTDTKSACSLFGSSAVPWRARDVAPPDYSGFAFIGENKKGYVNLVPRERQQLRGMRWSSGAAGLSLQNSSPPGGMLQDRLVAHEKGERHSLHRQPDTAVVPVNAAPRAALVSCRRDSGAHGGMLVAGYVEHLSGEEQIAVA